MDFTIHNQVLLAVFVVAAIMGAVANKTSFCTMGAVSDWVNIDDTGRMRAWVFAMAVALTGVLVLDATATVRLTSETFPPYRTAQFAWLRYLVGGMLFGIGMTLGSGCGNKTLVRVGTGNFKSLVVLAVAAIAAYLMMWTAMFEKAFLPWIAWTTINLSQYGMPNQEFSTVLAAMFGMKSAAGFQLAVGAIVAVAMLAFVFKSEDFRGSRDNILGGGVVGLAVVAGWWITGGPWGQRWKDFADMAIDIPSRVQVQSYTFVSPMGDSARYLLTPDNLSLINFGVAALAGVIAGSLVYALTTRSFRIEWFANGRDFVNHVFGGALMGVGGVLSMGCTIGQAITGVSTLAVGSILTFLAIVIGASGTMKYQYWRMMREA
jgi:uncharacterized protein